MVGSVNVDGMLAEPRNEQGLARQERVHFDSNQDFFISPYFITMEIRAHFIHPPTPPTPPPSKLGGYEVPQR